MVVKFCGLLSEVISNLNFSWNKFEGAQEMQFVLAILVLIFGVLEGSLNCYVSRVRENSGQSAINNVWV